MRRQRRHRRGRLTQLALHERLHDLVTDHRAAGGDRRDRADEIVDVVSPLLQHVAPPARSLTQQHEREARFQILREDEHADIRAGAAQLSGRLNSFIGERRRHADVGEHDVGLVGVHGGEQLVQRGTAGHHVDAPGSAQQAAEALTQEWIVLGKHDANGPTQAIDSTLVNPPTTEFAGAPRRRRRC